jgi:hypothetical protein
MDEQEVRRIIRDELMDLVNNEKYTFSKPIQILDGRNIQAGRTTGTKIGTATDQKLSVYGETPVVQASAITAPTDAGALYNQSTAQTNVDAVKAIITALKNFGITA